MKILRHRRVLIAALLFFVFIGSVLVFALQAGLPDAQLSPTETPDPAPPAESPSPSLPPQETPEESVPDSGPVPDVSPESPYDISGL